MLMSALIQSHVMETLIVVMSLAHTHAHVAVVTKVMEEQNAKVSGLKRLCEQHTFLMYISQDVLYVLSILWQKN